MRIFFDRYIKRYAKYEIQKSSKRKNNQERFAGAVGRPFKIDLTYRFVMLLACYHLYITYTLAGFLFDLDQSHICRNIQKIEQLVRKCLPIPQKTFGLTKRQKTFEEIEKYFPGFIAFIDCTEQQIPRPIDNTKRKIFYLDKKIIHAIKTQLMVDNRGFIIHKTRYKKGTGMTMISI